MSCGYSNFFVLSIDLGLDFVFAYQAPMERYALSEVLVLSGWYRIATSVLLLLYVLLILG
ncbi:hypothetical protein Plhal304r1_c061g0148171 [Plasmopara halstedii]